jgi:uncharacterized damage-inducible protein DinB
MTSNEALADILLAQWRASRQMTFDYLAMLTSEQLDLRLPFAESQSIGYQFWCMVGAQESYLRKLEHGAWQGFSSSLDTFDHVTPAIIVQQMRAADDAMASLVRERDLTAPLANGQRGYDVIFQLIKHEIQHHGQLINLLYCHHLPIPESWVGAWALSYDASAPPHD